MIHYKDQEAAQAKWRRRSTRITWSNLRVKLCWHEQPGMEELAREFDSLPLSSKLLLAPPDAPKLRHSVALGDYSTDGTQQYWRGHKAFNVAAYLETGQIRRMTPWRIIDWMLYWRY